MQNRKILIVDDDLSIHRLLLRGLEGQPYDVTEAFNGIEALQKIAENKPELLILDVNMPEMDGRDVMKDLRSRPETQKIPVIMLTGLGEMMDKMVGFELGVDSYVTKPFEMKELLARVREHLK